VSVRSEPVNQTSLKQLKLQTSNMTSISRDSPDMTLQNFSKGAKPQNFWALNAKAPKRLKLQTSNLTSMFPGTVRT